MIMKLIIVSNMLTCGLLGTIWNCKGWINAFIKIWLVLVAVADLVILLKLEGYIIKGG